MGRTKTKKSARTASKLEPAPVATPSSSSASPPSAASLFEKAQVLAEQCNYDLAQRFLERALEQDPTHIAARELLGAVQLEMGDLEAATQTFESLLPPSPHAPDIPSTTAHLNLAQLCEDPNTALQHYQAAADVLLAQLKERTSPDQDELRAKAVGALVAMVEIWMTDLCFEDAAEETCDRLATLALQTDPESSEALQTLASVRMSQKRPAEAQECAERAWSRWRDLDPDAPAVPPTPVRMALVRLFLELELFAHALAVLSGVLAVDDQETEAWYLEGWCFFLMSEKARETHAPVEGLEWVELARDARDCLETCQMLHTTQNHPDEQILQHAQEIIAGLAAAGVEATADGDDGGGAGDEGDEDAWEDDDGDEDRDGDVEME